MRCAVVRAHVSTAVGYGHDVRRLQWVVLPAELAAVDTASLKCQHAAAQFAMRACGTIAPPNREARAEDHAGQIPA